MKITKLSLIAALAISAAFAGGDIEKPEVIIVPTPEVATTVDGLAKLYYMSSTPDSGTASTGSIGGVTLNVTHKLFDGVTANFSAVGTMNFSAENKSTNLMIEKVASGTLKNPTTGNRSTAGAFFNVANLTFNYGDTTIIAGRQILNSPMIGSYDWQMAPSSYEAYTVVNSSISGLTLVGTYLTKHRGQGNGDIWTDLTSTAVGIGNAKGQNWAGAAIYNAGDYGTLSAWYYNVDIFDYTQYYVDYGFKAYGMGLKVQYVGTTYGTTNASAGSAGPMVGTDNATAIGTEVSAEAYGWSLAVAYAQLAGNKTGYIDRDGLYTTSWMTQASLSYNGKDTATYKVTAKGDIFGLNTTLSYAGYGDDGSEIDAIFGYTYNKTLGAQVVYSSTTANTSGAKATNVVEVALTYKF